MHLNTKIIGNIKKILLKIIKINEIQAAKCQSEKKLTKKTVKAKVANHFRDRRGALRNISLIPDYQFKRIFRLDKETFGAVLLKLNPLLEKDSKKALLNGSGGEISPEIILLATLRILAGGMKWDICLSLDIGFGSLRCRAISP